MTAVAAAMAPAEPVLEVRGLRKAFGAIEVLRDIDLEMARGDFLVLVGPSGCGKSTLLNCIAGLEETTAGQIFIAGREVTQVPPRDRDIAMVFQSYALYPTMTVAENIAFGMKVRHVPRAVQQQKLAEVASLLQIQHLLARKPGALSGGQRQRVAMGRALVREPVLFLFDEPLSNLDAKLRVELRGEIKRLHERLAASIVYVTHDQIEAMTLGTRIVVLKDGAIQQVGTPAEIYERPRNVFVADFMGSPPMNLLAADVSLSAQGAQLRFSDGNYLVDPNPPAALRERDGAPVVFGIRPESFALGIDPVISPRATLVENAGSDTFVTLALGGKSVVARLPGKARIAAGQPVPLAIDNAGLNYFDASTGLRIG